MQLKYGRFHITEQQFQELRRKKKAELLAHTDLKFVLIFNE